MEAKTIGHTPEKIKQKIEEFKRDEYLTPAQRELRDEMYKIYDPTGNNISDTYEKMENKIFVKEDKYYPIKKNRQLIEEIPEHMKEDSSMLDTQQQFEPQHLKKGFTKTAKGSKIVPLNNAEIVLLSHLNE